MRGPGHSRSEDPGAPADSLAVVFRHRVSLSADARGLVLTSETDGAVPRDVADNIRTSITSGYAARMVWADARLMEPGHPLGHLLPKRHDTHTAQELPAWNQKPQSFWPYTFCRRVAPWLAALFSAGVGFLIFLQRAA